MEIIGRSYRSEGNWFPVRIKCDCGRELDLWEFTNTCVCGADYNMGGQRLAPRSQWGEETGESIDDILGVGHQSEDDE